MTEIGELPVEALDGDIALLGRKGGGKTFSAKGIVERLLDMGRRVLILDPLGVWAGLRTSADGQRPGYPVAIIGGEHADLPLDPAAAAPLAEVIAKENLPTVIDLSELSKSQQGLFLFRFLGELRKVNRDALTIVLEEADVFAPQNPQGDDSKALHNEIDWIARRGRFRGFRLITITQRPARLSKDVLTQCSTLIAHRLPAPQDRDAIKAWVDGNGDRDQAKAVFDTLAGLKVGEAWVWSPENDILSRMKFPHIKTLDTSSTPKAGEARVSVKTLAQVDLSGIKKALAEAAAAEKPAKVGKQIGQAPAGFAGDVRAAIEGARKAGFDVGYSKGIAAGRRHIAGLLPDFRKAIDATIAEAERLCDVADGYPENAAPPPGGAPAPIAKGEVRHYDADNGEMPTVAAKIIDAIDMKPARAFSWTQVAMLAGYKESGGQFRRGKKWVLETGAAVEEGGRVRIAKPTGKTTAPTGAALVALWRSKLPSVGATILDNLWENRAAPIRQISNVASETNYAETGGQFRRGVKALRDAAIVDVSGGTIRFAREFLELMAGGR